jgi:hypothetical protein
MISNVVQVLPKKLMRTIEHVKLKEGRQLNNKVRRDRGTHAMDSGTKQTNRPQVGRSIVPASSASMARWGSRLSARGLSMDLYDPWLALLQIDVEDDAHLVHDLGVLREHAPQERA